MRHDLLPPHVPPGVAKLRDEAAKLTGQRDAATSAVARAHEQVVVATAADLTAAAAAVRRGQPDPGTPLTAKATAALEAAQRQHALLGSAVAGVETELADIITKEAPAWAQRLDEDEASCRERYAAALDAFDAARRALMLNRATRSWLSDTAQRFNQNIATGGYIVGLVTPNGSPPSASEVIAALRLAGQPPPPTPTVEQPGISRARPMPVPENGYGRPTSAPGPHISSH